MTKRTIVEDSKKEYDPHRRCPVVGCPRPAVVEVDLGTNWGQTQMYCQRHAERVTQ